MITIAPKKRKISQSYLIKEVFILVLSALSVSLLALEWLVDSNPELDSWIEAFDLIVAIILLVDFSAEIYLAKSRLAYLGHNWYLLLAAIPIVSSWAQALRILRVLRALRIIRAGVHLEHEAFRK